MKASAVGSGGEPDRKVVTLRYQKHHFKPEDLLDFIELPQFTKRWEKLGLDDEDDLSALQLFIMAAPKGAPLLRGMGGVRKLRFAPERWKCGGRGAARVLYKHFEEFGIVLLCLVFGKEEIEDISPAVKKHVRKLLKEVERELERRKLL